MVDPPYQKNFEWEKFDYVYWRQWMGQRWWWSIIFGGVYVVLIYFGQHWMKNRSPMKLKKPLLWWNLALAAFSISAFMRTLPEMISILGNNNGFHITVCSRDQMTIAHVFWEWMGTWSKVVELGDTAFVVLRKQPLIFLHWYHHVSVLIYTWFSIDANDPIHRWYMSMNSGIHSLMYSYYALRILGVKIPRKCAICVTTLQIVQMFIGFSLNIYSVYAKRSGWDYVLTPEIAIETKIHLGYASKYASTNTYVHLECLLL
ncbi:unnamed protein product [Allacma fusca]|uniref:Elongation of very long chain fatty acids protein n=1 Tax=Allacma fusca TaxID=39272 RepID=A0A8J2LF84_9HEXA|nr:unnamed protein product [Allacma fusca]